MNNLELTEQKKNFKNPHFRGRGFYAVLETYYVYRYFKYF